MECRESTEISTEALDGETVDIDKMISGLIPHQ
jgi:hypothetical protein